MVREKPFQKVEVLVNQSYKCGKMHEPIPSEASLQRKGKEIRKPYNRRNMENTQ